MKFDRQLRPATKTSWVVSYGGRTIPRWRTAAILKIDISPYLSEKSSDFYEILYTAADFELDERHVIENEKVAFDRLRVRRNVFLVWLWFSTSSSRRFVAKITSTIVISARYFVVYWDPAAKRGFTHWCCPSVCLSVRSFVCRQGCPIWFLLRGKKTPSLCNLWLRRGLTRGVHKRATHVFLFTTSFSSTSKARKEGQLLNKRPILLII